MISLQDPTATGIREHGILGSDARIEQSNSTGKESRSTVAPPLVGATTSRRAGDLPYSRVDPRWLRTYLPITRARAKHLVRNNRHARTAARDLPTDIVGTGIHPVLEGDARKTWEAWSGRRRRVHAEKRLPWVGLQWMIARSVMVSGECFAVLRRQRMGSNVIPIRIALFDADGLSETPAGNMPSMSWFDSGREYGPGGMVRAYHFRVATMGPVARSVRVPASDVVHFYDPEECGALQGITWFAPVVLDLNELAGYQDSTAAKQHLASKITFATTDVQSGPPSHSTEGTPVEDLEPGAEIFIPPGREFKSFEPPLVREYSDYVKANRGEIAVALGTTPEALSGDYSGMNYSVARASHVNHWQRLSGFRVRFMRPGLEEIYDWAAWAMGGKASGWPAVDEIEWAMPVMRALDPDRDGIANQRNVRNGFSSWSETVRARGHDPERLLAEIADERQRFKDSDVVLDSDPGQVTNTGQTQSVGAGAPVGSADE